MFRWGGSRIIRFSPDGKIDLQVVFPTALNITACSFGGASSAHSETCLSKQGFEGENNDQLYVTTAHCGAIGGDAERQMKYPDSGHIFLLDLSGEFTGSKRWAFDG